ncbi:transcription factor MYB3R-3 [Canna indica]|uniref:Transcription factor MYB3R-3 n=1 Tax=Canna indica TaxID=4628 RepID=A0AAQ3KZV7_9LILI|nr:transcription factor MYB3R-3 [Canna indica]
MAAAKVEQSCVENKQLSAASSSSLSGGSYGLCQKSPDVSSPLTPSPSRRRNTGPIRRTKGGWTPEEFASSMVLQLNFFQDEQKSNAFIDGKRFSTLNLLKEDEKIVNLVAKYGPTKWSFISKSLPGRIRKQCRERTDNSIKNRWNSSLKKKLDFYLTTRKLPPVPNSIVLKGPDLSSRAFDRSSRSIESDLPDKSCKVEDKNDVFMSRASQIPESLNSVALPPRELNNCTAKGCSVQNICIKSDSGAELRKWSIIGENYEANGETGATLHSEMPSTFGSLCYEPPPQLEDNRASITSTLLPTYDFMWQSFSELIYDHSFPLVKVKNSVRSAESVLRNAARSFPNTPSILRRKKEVQTSLPPDNTLQNDTTIAQHSTGAPLGGGNVGNSAPSSSSTLEVDPVPSGGEDMLNVKEFL